MRPQMQKRYLVSYKLQNDWLQWWRVNADQSGCHGQRQLGTFFKENPFFEGTGETEVARCDRFCEQPWENRPLSYVRMRRVK